MKFVFAFVFACVASACFAQITGLTGETGGAITEFAPIGAIDNSHVLPNSLFDLSDTWSYGNENISGFADATTNLHQINPYILVGSGFLSSDSTITFDGPATNDAEVSSAVGMHISFNLASTAVLQYDDIYAGLGGVGPKELSATIDGDPYTPYIDYGTSMSFSKTLGIGLHSIDVLLLTDAGVSASDVPNDLEQAQAHFVYTVQAVPEPCTSCATGAGLCIWLRKRKRPSKR